MKTSIYPGQLSHWIPAIFITAGFLGMEGLIHERQALALGFSGGSALWSSSRTFWEAVYFSGYLFYFAPFFISTVSEISKVAARVLLGFSFQLLAGGLLLWAAPGSLDFFPCLHVGNAFFLLLLSRKLRETLLTGFTSVMLAMVVAAILMTQRHDVMDVLVGLVLGGISFYLMFGAAASVFFSRTHFGEQVFTALALTILLSLGFYATDYYMALKALEGGDFFSPAFPVDNAIPFRPGWVWIYFLYFPFCFLPLVFKEVRKEIGIFRRTALGFGIQFAVALIIFWLLPSQMQRPSITTVGLSAQALDWFYRLDPGFNIFPSLHVANAAFIACLAFRLGSPVMGAAAWITTFLIAASTVLVKQHYLVDIPAGFLLGVACYRVAFYRSVREILYRNGHRLNGDEK